MKTCAAQHNISLALILAAMLAGCEPIASTKVDSWVCSDMTTLTDRTPKINDTTIYDPIDKAVNLFAAANETISFQLVLDGDNAGTKGVQLSWTTPRSSSAEAAAAIDISAFQMLPVKVESFPPWYIRIVDSLPEPASYYDALLPINRAGAKNTIDVPAGGRAAVWLDIQIPRDAEAGVYSSTLTVTWPTGSQSFKLNIEVYDFSLPDAIGIISVGGFDDTTLYRTFITRDDKPYVPVYLDRNNESVRAGLVILRQLMQLSHEHRLDLFDKGIRPLIKRDVFGNLQLDWDDYDAIVMPYLDGSAFDDSLGCPVWPVPFSAGWPDPAIYEGRDSKKYAEVADGVIKATGKHFRELNIQEKCFAWPYRLGVSETAYPRHIELVKILRRTEDKTPILSQLPLDAPDLTRWTVPPDYQSTVDMLAAPGQWLDPGTAPPASVSKPLAGVWLSPGLPPYMPSMGIIATPADVRAIPWFAVKYRCKGLFLPEVLNWTENILDTTAGAETRLFYPGKQFGMDEVLPSVRLKRLRRGLQDVAYLRLLEARQQGQVASAIMNSMVRYAGMEASGDNYLDPRLSGWVQDPSAWLLARRLLAEEVSNAVHAGQTPRRQLLEQRIAWDNFQMKTHDVHVEQIRTFAEIIVPEVKSEIDLAGVDPRIKATITLDLYNEYNKPINTVVEFGPLPEGWKPVAGKISIESFEPATRKSVQLAAEGPRPPGNTAGKTIMPIRITTNARPAKLVSATLPIVIAGRTAGSILIDGVPNEWPMRAGNTAGDFRLIGRRGRDGSGLAKRQTSVFVLRDDDNLYLTIRCAEPNMAGIVADTNNTVHYEQLMACGEDLVEVLLDPGKKAESIEDLYHLVVKANGIVIAERGVSCDPPLGRVSAWPVQAKVAVSKQKDVWFVEAAIPLEAFGENRSAEVWGINFMRFATQGSEASNWAEAPRYFYDPRNLGTMLIRPFMKPG